MLKRIEDFLFNKFAGKLLARAAVTVCAYLASGAIGVKVDIDPTELATAVQLGAHAAYEWLKARRNKPAEPQAK